MMELSALVVDPSASYSHNISASLKALGWAEENIFIAKKFNDAKNIITARKPDVLITEYSIDGKQGHELVQLLNSQSANKISVIVSHNNTSSSIAEAAEELVDDYIVKPFQGSVMSDRLKEILHRKNNPSEYIKIIREGKQKLLDGQVQDAELDFQTAMMLEQKPTLAHYYLGYAKLVQTDYRDAVGEFKKGLHFQPLHFKCLTGNFDAFFEQKNYESAYRLAPTLLNNYPIGPKRLGNLFISAVFSGHLEDVPKYHSLFLSLDHVTPELRKVFSAALLAAGRFQITRDEVDKAADCFELGVQVVGSDMEYIDKAVRALIAAGGKGPQRSLSLLQKFPKHRVGEREHSALVFLIAAKLQTRQQAMDLGRRLVINGYADADCYQVLLKLLVSEGKMTLAEDVAAKAVRTYPQLRKAINEILEKRSA